jgi:hypothetical protein
MYRNIVFRGKLILIKKIHLWLNLKYCIIKKLKYCILYYYVDLNKLYFFYLISLRIKVYIASKRKELKYIFFQQKNSKV